MLHKLGERKVIVVSITMGCALILLALSLSHHASAQVSLFSDNFEDGNANGWSRSGGTWSVVTDGSRVAGQSGTGSDARMRAGATSWTNYAVQARVKPLAFGGAGRYVALIARAQNVNHFYYLALQNGNQLVLAKRDGGTSTTLASRSFTVSTGTFYTLRIEAQGSALRAFVNGALQLSANDGQYSSGSIGVAAFFASGRFDDVVVTTLSGSTPVPTPTGNPTPRPTPGPGPGPTPGPTPTPPTGGNPTGLVGFAATGSGTTGGAGGPTVTVTNQSQLIEALGRSGPLIIRVSGIISGPGSMQRVTSNKSILGVGSNSGINGFGLNLSNVSNIIIRNMRFTGANDDSINIQESAHHIWIDHCDLSNGFDGVLDIKRGSDFITVSWNHFHDHEKTALLGHSDDNAAQDVGHLRVTYHHNWFNATNSRHPRVRFGDPVHVYNNYYLSVGDYGVTSTMGAGVLVEGNYFENVEEPCLVGFADSDPGDIEARNNVFNNSGPCEAAGTVNQPRSFYNYTVDNPASVPAIVRAGAGVGKIGL